MTEIASNQAILQVIAALDALRVPYMVVGSLSTNLYGIPRSTQDADFVVQLEQVTLSQIARQLGGAFVLEDQSRFESITATICHRIAVRNRSFKIELFELSNDAHDQERFRRRVRIDTQYGLIWAASPEDVVVTKSRWALRGKRVKDREDIQNVLKVSGANLDWDYIYRWTDLHGSRQLLDEILASIKPA